MHLLGLNWQLQPADGHTFNNGIRTGLPGNDDVATMPSGGKGEVTAAAFAPSRSPENAALSPAGSGFLIQILGGMQKRKRKKGGRRLSKVPPLEAVCCSCLLALFGRSPELARCLLGTNVHTYAICSTWRALELLESIPRPGQKPQHQQQLEKVLRGGESPEPREASPGGGEGDLPREESPPRTA